MKYTSEILPKHVSIIMDGNGRWASKRARPRILGHQKGVDVLHDIIEHAHDCGITTLSAWAFSTSNWNRPADEVAGLMKLMRRTLQKDIDQFHKRNARLRIVGFREGLQKDLVGLIEHSERVTANNTAMDVIIFFNYDGQADIVQAVQRCIAEDIMEPTKQDINQRLLTGDMPDPDLLIRTSGIMRISNYMLWQTKFTEYFFSEKLWPDFTRADLDAALAYYTSVDRKFGFVNAEAARQVVA